MSVKRSSKTPVHDSSFGKLSMITLFILSTTTLTLCATVRAFPNFDYGKYFKLFYASTSHVSLFFNYGECIYITAYIPIIGGKTHSQFLQRAIERSTPSNARLLAELFGGLELGLDLGADGAQAIISVGGAATRCQHQSPCFDMQCNLCYDPLLRIHGKCGGASYFTCRGTLPKACLPYTCTAKVSHTV